MTLKQFCFSFQGRINRKMYWFYFIASVIMTLMASLIVVAFNAQDAPEPAVIILLPFIVIKLIIDLVVTVKRLHDTNRTGWLILIGLLPVIGVLYLIIVCGFLAGTDNDNKYGTPPVDKLT